MEHPPKLTKKLEDVTKEDLTAELFWLEWSISARLNFLITDKNFLALEERKNRIAYLKTLLLLKQT